MYHNVSVGTMQVKVDISSVRQKHQSSEEGVAEKWNMQDQKSPSSEDSVQYTFSPEVQHKVRRGRR